MTRRSISRQSESSPENVLVCEYIRDTDVLKFTLPASIAPEDLKENVEILLTGIATCGRNGASGAGGMKSTVNAGTIPQGSPAYSEAHVQEEPKGMLVTQSLPLMQA